MHLTTPPMKTKSTGSLSYSSVYEEEELEVLESAFAKVMNVPTQSQGGNVSTRL